MVLSRSFYGLSLLFFLLTGLAAPVQAQQPYQASDDAWLDVRGTVVMLHEDLMVVDFGDNVLKVEMADEDRMVADYDLRPGDSVAVAGRIDDRTFDARTLEAHSVYVDRHGTTYYDAPRDAKRPVAISLGDVEAIPLVTLTGVVTEIAGPLLKVRVGDQTLIVDTGTLPVDVTDDPEYPEVDVGTRVEVTGRAGPDFLDGGAVEAKSIRVVAG